MIEEVRTLRRFYESLNAMFLTRIPKKELLVSFNDFRPISLCNLLYKLIAKLLTERLKPYLGKFISAEQFASRPYRQISDAVGVA